MSLGLKKKIVEKSSASILNVLKFDCLMQISVRQIVWCRFSEISEFLTSRFLAVCCESLAIFHKTLNMINFLMKMLKKNFKNISKV